MKQLLLIAILFIASVSINAQQFALHTQRPAINEIAAIEAKESGKAFSYGAAVRFTVSKGYFPGEEKYNLDNPLTWRRTEPLKIQVQYYYSLPDSIVRLAEYTLNNADTVLLKQVFENNMNQVATRLGKEKTDATEYHEDWNQRTVTWENTEGYVKQFMVIGSGTYRVRVLVSWK